MLRFNVYLDGAPAKSLDLTGAHLLGNERVPLRGEIRFENGQVICETRARGAAALAILWPVRAAAAGSTLMLETTRLVERNEPYNLHVELARGQLMRIIQKREDWGLFDYPEGAAVYKQIDLARDHLVAAMTAEDALTATKHADASIAAGLKAAEAIAALHADVCIKRREPTGSFARRPFGCRILPAHCTDAALTRATDAFDFVTLPCDWVTTQPQAGKFELAELERCAALLKAKKLPVTAGPLLSFDDPALPDYVQRKNTTFDSFRDAAARHLKHVITALAPHVTAWEVVRGLHAHNVLRFNFEQLVDLSRLAALTARQCAPRSAVILGIAMPWGEYYAADPQTIPPVLYAEMAVQSGIPFDAFGLEIWFGSGADPGSGRRFVRDMMQVSSMLDRFGAMGKPVHITAAGVPSGGEVGAGCWRGAWSAINQAAWAKEFYRIALSKPFVETICWRHLIDRPDSSSGVVCADLSPKPAFDAIQTLRAEISAGA